MRLHEDVDRPNLMVKIPATKPGLAAIEDVIAKGRSINVTLIFSLRRYARGRRVLRARARAAGRRGRRPAQGRLGGELLRLAHRHRGRPAPGRDRRPRRAKGKLAIANAKLAYAHYLEAFSGPRWEYLAAKGATPQRVLWASTSTKNPAYPDTLYVEELIGPDTVNTMPEETIKAYQDHGDPQPRLQSGLDGGAARCSSELERGGRRLRRRHRHARARGRREIRRLLRRAAARRSRAKRESLAPA